MDLKCRQIGMYVSIYTAQAMGISTALLMSRLAGRQNMKRDLHDSGIGKEKDRKRHRPVVRCILDFKTSFENFVTEGQFRSRESWLRWLETLAMFTMVLEKNQLIQNETVSFLWRRKRAQRDVFFSATLFCSMQWNCCIRKGTSYVEGFYTPCLDEPSCKDTNTIESKKAESHVDFGSVLRKRSRRKDIVGMSRLFRWKEQKRMF